MSYFLISILVIFALCILMIFWMLFSPIKIIINSSHHLYQLNWLGIGNIYLKWIEETPIAIIKILKWSKKIDLLNLEWSAKKESNKPSSPRQKKTQFFTWKKIKSVITSFEVKKLSLHVDTDDYILNAYLYPISTLISRKNQIIRINYNADNQLQCVIENKLYRIMSRLLFS